MYRAILNFWNQVFKNAMVLSDNAKRFAIAREIYRGKTNTYFTHGVILPTFIGMGYLMSRVLNKKLLLLRRPPIYRGIMYCIMATVSIILQYCSKILTSIIQTLNWMKRLANLEQNIQKVASNCMTIRLGGTWLSDY